MDDIAEQTAVESAGDGRVWSQQRRLIASGGGQAVFRHT